MRSEEVLSDARLLGQQVQEDLQELQGAAAPLFPRMRFLLLCSFGLLLGVLDTNTGELAYVNATPAMLLHGGSLSSLPGSSGEIRQQNVRLSPWDFLCLYTKHNVSECQWLPEGLQEKLIAVTSPVKLTAILTDFLKTAGHEGDITVLAMQWRG